MNKFDKPLLVEFVEGNPNGLWPFAPGESGDFQYYLEEDPPHPVGCPEKSSPISEQPTGGGDWDEKTDPDFNGSPPSELPPEDIRAALHPEKVYP